MTQPRVAYVSPIAADSESRVREAHQQFPANALTELGASSISAFIGSGYYVLVFEFPNGDFQEQFSRFCNHPSVRAFFDGLTDYLEEPLPHDVGPADRFHRGAAGAAGQTTAQLPLAGEIFHWGGTAGA